MDLHLTEKEAGRVLAIKRDLHMHPELSHEEYRTTEKIREVLSGLPGIEILELPDTSVVKTGVVARCGAERAAGRPAFGRTSMPFRRPSRLRVRTNPDARVRCTPADTTFTPRRFSALR